MGLHASLLLSGMACLLTVEWDGLPINIIKGNNPLAEVCILRVASSLQNKFKKEHPERFREKINRPKLVSLYAAYKFHEKLFVFFPATLPQYFNARIPIQVRSYSSIFPPRRRIF